MKIGIIGVGRIGSEVARLAANVGWKIIIARNSGVYERAVVGWSTNQTERRLDDLCSWVSYFQDVDVVVLCIPTFDNGEVARDYIKTLVGKGIPVVTSEKGALGNYFSELKPWLGKIGYSATVGGGTRMLQWLKGRLNPRTQEIHLIINGTLNYIFDGLSRGRALDEVVEETKKLGYAEPKAESALEVVNTESCRDIPMKISVLLNICGLAEISAMNIIVKNLTGEDLKRLVREASFRRYIVSITKEEDKEDMIGGFRVPLKDYYVSAGFKNRTQNPLFLQLIPPGVNNAALIHGDDGTYILTGPGAGAVPTVMGAIVKDITDLMGGDS